MRLSIPMIQIFAHTVRGKNTIQELSNATSKSLNRTTEILNQLEEQSLITKKRTPNLKNSRITLEIAQTNHAQKFKELIIQYSSIKFEDLLSDSKLLFLATLAEDWTDIKTSLELCKISKYAIERIRPMLINRGIIIRKGKLYKLNEKAWPLLKEFLIAYKNYSNLNGLVKWKYLDETLFEVDNLELIKGSLTGLTKYKDHGIKVNTISSLCRLPEKKLSKQEIFIHSLFEINDPRTLYLALAFYIKNKLKSSSIAHLAMKYGKHSMFEDFTKILKSKEEKIITETLPPFSRKEFERVKNLYNIN